MSRPARYSRTSSTVWTDDDYRALPQAAKALYQQMLSHPKCNVLGVGPWNVQEFVDFDPDTTPESVIAAAEILVEQRYVVIHAGSYIVRSHLRHNLHLFRNPKNSAGVKARYLATFSKRLRHTALHEMWRLRTEHPGMPGWDVVEQLFKDAKFDYEQPVSLDVSSVVSGVASTVRSSDGSSDTTGDGSTDRSSLKLLSSETPKLGSSATGSSDPAADAPRDKSRTSVPDGFEEFWEVYGKKRGRAEATAAYKAALRKVDARTLIDAASKHAEHHRRAKTDDHHIPWAQKWLKGERWADELPALPSDPDGQSAATKPRWEDIPVPPDDGTPEEIAAWYRAEEERKRARMRGGEA